MPDETLWLGSKREQVFTTEDAMKLLAANGTTTLWKLARTGAVSTEGSLTLTDGGAVTQITTITTGVQLDTHSGQITLLTNPSIAAAAEVSIIVTNAVVTTVDTVVVNVATQFSDGLVIAFVSAITNGTFTITLSNVAAAAVSAGTAVLNFTVISGSAT